MNWFQCPMLYRSRLILLIFTLLFLNSGCSSLSNTHVDLVAHSVAVVDAEGQSTIVEVDVRTPFQWGGVKRGAIEGMASCANVQVSGGAEALAQLLLCFPISGLIGAIAGYVSDPSPLPAKLDGLESFVGDGRPQTLIQQYTAQIAREAGLMVVESSQSKHAETYAELWLKTIQLKVVSDASSVKVSIALEVRVRLLESGSKTPVKIFFLKHASQPRSYRYWLTDDYAPVHEFVKAAAERVVKRLAGS